MGTWWLVTRFFGSDSLGWSGLTVDCYQHQQWLLSRLSDESGRQPAAVEGSEWGAWSWPFCPFLPRHIGLCPQSVGGGEETKEPVEEHQAVEGMGKGARRELPPAGWQASSSKRAIRRQWPSWSVRWWAGGARWATRSPAWACQPFLSPRPTGRRETERSQYTGEEPDQIGFKNHVLPISLTKQVGVATAAGGGHRPVRPLLSLPAYWHKQVTSSYTSRIYWAVSLSMNNWFLLWIRFASLLWGAFKL